MIKIVNLMVLLLLSACGGGGGGGVESANNSPVIQSPVVTLLPSSQSSSLLISYLNVANQTKYDSYFSAATSNTWTYATSVGGRVSGNGLLIAANSQSFKVEVDKFLLEFIKKVNEIGLTYVLDSAALKNELSIYQQNDVSYLLINIGGTTADATYINNIYLNAALRIPS